MQNLTMAELQMADGDVYKLLGNRVLLQLDKSSEYYELNGRKSIIKIPDRYTRFVYSGIIRAIGAEVENEQYNLSLGQKCLFCSTLKGLNLTINDLEYKVLAPYDIEAKIVLNDLSTGCNELNVRREVIIPMLDRVLIKPIEQENKGLILVPDSVKQDTCSGVVVATGNGVLNEAGERIPMEVKVGDNVYYSKFSGMQLPINEETHILINESNIFFVFEKGE